MAPKDIELQTFDIINNLFDDFDESQTRNFGSIEPDGPCDDTFDAALIADKLRELGDDYDEKRIQPLIKKLKQAAADEMVEEFQRAVEELCQSPVAQKAEVAPELQLLQASVALGLYVKKKSPDLIDKVKAAMTTFVNSRLAGWVRGQGGWEAATN